MKYDTIPDSRNHLAADKIRTQVIMTREKYARLKAQANRLGISYSSYIKPYATDHNTKEEHLCNGRPNC